MPSKLSSPDEFIDKWEAKKIIPLAKSNEIASISSILAEKFDSKLSNQIYFYLNKIKPQTTDLVFNLLETFEILSKEPFQIQDLKDFASLVYNSLTKEPKTTEKLLSSLLDKFTINSDDPTTIYKEYIFLKFCLSKKLTEEDTDKLYSKVQKHSLLQKSDDNDFHNYLNNIYQKMFQDRSGSLTSGYQAKLHDHEAKLKEYLQAREQVPRKKLDHFNTQVFEETNTPLTPAELKKIKQVLSLSLEQKLPRTRNRDGSLRTPKSGSNLPQDYYLKIEQELGFPLHLSVIKTDKGSFIIYPGKTTITDQKAETLLGKGSLDTRVKLIQNLDTKEIAAIKIQSTTYFAPSMLEYEKAMLALTEQLIATHQTENKDYSLMKYIKGVTLHDYLNDHNIPVTSKLKAIAMGLQAVKELHEQKKILHCDLSMNNIIIATSHDKTQPLTATIIDYAFALRLNPDTNSATIVHNIHGRTKDYLAPEYNELKPVTTATDIYTLGKWLQKFNQEKNIQLKEQPIAAQLSKLFTDMHNPDPAKRPPIDSCITSIDSVIKAIEASSTQRASLTTPTTRQTNDAKSRQSTPSTLVSSQNLSEEAPSLVGKPATTPTFSSQSPIKESPTTAPALGRKKNPE